MTHVITSDTGHKYIVNSDWLFDQHGSVRFEQNAIAIATGLSPGKTFVDVGAHSLTFSVPAAAAGATRVLAFEPQRDSYNRCCGTVALNGLDRVIEVYPFALGDEEGEAQLSHVSVDGGGSTLQLRKDNPEHKRVLQQETVQVKRLDDFALTNVGCIKVDVEGQELQVLRGARETIIKNGRPPLIFEAWDDDFFAQPRAELMSFVKNELGYPHIIKLQRSLYLAR